MSSPGRVKNPYAINTSGRYGGGTSRNLGTSMGNAINAMLSGGETQQLGNLDTTERLMDIEGKRLSNDQARAELGTYNRRNSTSADDIAKMLGVKGPAIEAYNAGESEYAAPGGAYQMSPDEMMPGEAPDNLSGQQTPMFNEIMQKLTQQDTSRMGSANAMSTMNKMGVDLPAKEIFQMLMGGNGDQGSMGMTPDEAQLFESLPASSRALFARNKMQGMDAINNLGAIIREDRTGTVLQLLKDNPMGIMSRLDADPMKALQKLLAIIGNASTAFDKTIKGGKSAPPNEEPLW